MGCLVFAAVGTASGPLFAQVSASPNSSSLSLLVSPIPGNPGEITLLLTGGTPGELPVVALSATEQAPIDAMASGLADPHDLEIFVGAPFSEIGFQEIVVPKPIGAAATTLFAQAIGMSPWEEPDLEDPTIPLVVSFIGSMSVAFGDKLFCLENFEIDDPLCSITNLGPNVGMMMEDGFGFAQVYTFKPGAVYAETFIGKTGSITAEIESINNPGYGWNVSIIVGTPSEPGDPGYPPAGAPYFGFGPLKNCPSYLASNGGPIDPNTWHYWETTFGTMTGTGGWAGAQATLNRFGGPFQVGVGANTANLQFGVSAWYDLAYLKQPTVPNPPLPQNGPVNCELFGDTRPCPNGTGNF